ncbi:MAG: PAS domain S-box protein [Kofleriaceae bacterium]
MATFDPSKVSRELRAVIRGAPDLYLLLTPDLRIIDASDTYLTATMTERAAIVGRDVFEVFPDDPANVGAEANARERFLRTINDKVPGAPQTLRYPIRGPSGTFEERYWRTVSTPVLDDSGEVMWLLHRAEDVTERMRLERLSAEARHYIELLDGAPDAIVIVGGDSRIQLVNRQTEALFGYTRSELVNQPLETLVPDRFRAGHAGHVARFFAASRVRPMGSGLRLFGRRKDGSELPIEVSLSPTRDEPLSVVASIRDISDRTRLEARLTSAIESIEHAFALFDANDELITCNTVFRELVHEPLLERLLGKRYEDVLDLWLHDIEFETEAERVAFRANRLARRHEPNTVAFDVRLRDGRNLRIVDRRTPEGGIVKTIVDRTADEHFAHELSDARSVAEAASAAKSEFLSSMSHELRTPMNAILGFAQLLDRDRKDPLTPRHRERVSQILRGGQHLLNLINEILDLSRIEAGGTSVSLEPVGVPDVLSEARRTLEPLAMRMGVVLTVADVDANLPLVIADRTRFAQILMNLGSNAIKYNRPHGVVRFLAVPSPTHVRVVVEDSGVGIPDAAQSKLFQPFQRAGQEAGPIEGTGIGLVITKRLAELMGGSVGFESTVGVGSKFWVELAIAPAVARPPQRVESSPHVRSGDVPDDRVHRRQPRQCRVHAGLLR